jgi:AGZA family xanthine/uracil permease-like MFS transporter
MPQMTEVRTICYPLLCKGDVDGFFGLAVDNLVQVLVLVALCKQMCGFTESMLVERVLPGIAVSLLIGNLYYSIHAWRVAYRDRNITCTALPYGVNTVSMFAFIIFIMGPVYQRFSHTSLGAAGAAELAWKMGLLACIGSGVIEFLCAFVGNWIRRTTPRAALLSTLAAVGVIFIAGPFAFQIYERPLVAMLPMMVILVVYFAKVRFPLGLPGGLVALIVGTGLAWAFGLYREPIMSTKAVAEAARWIGLHTPHVYWGDLIHLLRQSEHRDAVIGFAGIIVPMGLLNALGSLQNIESAEAGGDRFSTGSCMAVNGIGTVAAGLCGSCFPTTIYIGHPGWKALGARTGYSVLNAAFFTVVFFFGLGSLVTSVIPMEAGIAIVLWIGIIITAQSYEATPTRHYAAVAMGFFPAVAALAVLFLPNVLLTSGAGQGILPMIHGHTGHLANPAERTDNWWPIGIYALAGANSGFIVTCVMISAISAKLIDRQFRAAAVWSIIACVLTLIGLQHAFRIEPGQFELTPRELLAWQRVGWPVGAYLHRGYGIAIGYALAAAFFLVIHWLRPYGQFADIEPTEQIDRAKGHESNADHS